MACVLCSGSTDKQTVAAKQLPPAPSVPLQALQDFVIVYEQVRTEHVDFHINEELFKLAFTGADAKVGSLYFVFLDADATLALTAATTSFYVGIGIEIKPTGHYILVITPIEGSPAQLTGLGPGDWITHINKSSVKGLDHIAISNIISGPKGSDVTLTILRQEQDL